MAKETTYYEDYQDQDWGRFSFNLKICKKYKLKGLVEIFLRIYEYTGSLALVSPDVQMLQ